MLNGIVGEAAFSDGLADRFRGWGWSDVTASVSATAIVVAAITFLTIVFGELVPKRIGQLYPEAVARWVAQPMAGVARVAKPFVCCCRPPRMRCYVCCASTPTRPAR